MKMTFKKYLVMVLCVVLPAPLMAQQYSEWSVDPTVKTLKARYMYYKATDGNYWIKLEVQSSVECKLQMTSTVCNSDAKDKNGWKSIRLTRNVSKVLGFKVQNSCNNGWWWWYRAYNKIVYNY